MSEPWFSDVKVRLVGEDGNVFAIIARVSRALKRAGYVDEAADFTAQAFAAHSYEEVLGLCTGFVTVS